MTTREQVGEYYAAFNSGPVSVDIKCICAGGECVIIGLNSGLIKGQDVLSEDGKSFDRIVNAKDAEGRDTSVIQVFEKQ